MASRVCWNCGAYAYMRPVGEIWSRRSPKAVWYIAFICDSCGAMSVGTGSDQDLSDWSGQEASLVERLGYEPVITWIPAQGVGKRFDDVPTDIGQAASEAYACYSIGSYRAATLLARAVVEATAKDKGHTKGSLVSKIQALEEARTINPSLAEAAHEIRLMGNNMAHGDFMEPVSEEDCDDLLDFMSSLLEEVYQRPTILARRKQQRQERQAQGRD